jgi:hypothetical protein
MLINLYRKALNEIIKWFEITVAVISPVQQPIKIHIKADENFQQHGAQRKISTLKERY